MTLASHTSRIYMDEYDVQGAIQALRHAADDSTDPLDCALYVGAQTVLMLLLDHDRIDTQADFMTMFNAFIRQDTQQQEDK